MKNILGAAAYSCVANADDALEAEVEGVANN